jgi:GMP synthase-like glutamine amidotransferase
MEPILIVRAARLEGPGYLAEFLQEQGHAYRLLCLDRGESLPESIAGYAGVVLMGGPMSANDDLEWIRRALQVIRDASEADIPVLGHCLGGQLISKALGGVVTRSRVAEIGWMPVRIVPGPESRDWLAGLEKELDVFHWHGETFSIPAGASRILESTVCPNQAFVIGRTLAMQFHVEMTSEMVRAWAQESSGECDRPSPTVQSQSEMTMNLELRVERLQNIARTLYLRWIEGVRRLSG